MRKSNKIAYENDWKMYSEFVESWVKGILSEQNAVYRLVSQISSQVCNKCDCKKNDLWVRQICFINLAKENYSKEYPLETYIRQIISNELRKLNLNTQ